MAAAQSRPEPVATPTANVEKQGDLSLQFAQRISASEAALHAGDPIAIQKADAKVIALSLREMASIRVLERSYPQAIELYQESLTFEDVPEAHLDLARAFLHAKSSTDAIAESEKVIFTDPNNVDAWEMQANAWLQNDDYRQAAAAFAHALKLKGQVETAYSLAICFLNLHEKDKARMVFQDMIAHYGDSGALHVLFGRAYRDVNDFDAAISEFRRAIALDPSTPHANYFLGLSLLVQKEWGPPTPEILALIHRELKRDPRDFLANYLLGLLASRAKNYEDASRYLEIATSISPIQPDPWLIMGQDDYDQHNYQRATPELRKAIELTGDDEARNNYQIRKGYIDLARILLDEGKRDEAETYFAKARALQNRNLALSQQAVANVISSGGGVTGMGAVVPLMERQAEESAASDLKSVDPTANVEANSLERANLTDAEKKQLVDEEKYLRGLLAKSFNDTGTAAARTQDYRKALVNFEQAQKWDPELPNLSRNLGTAAFRLKDYSEAGRFLSKAAGESPNDLPVRAMLGLSLYFSGDYNGAAKTIGTLGSAATNDPGLAFPLAESLVKTGQFEQAGKILDQVERQPLPPETLMLIGQTWSEMTNYDRAVKTFHVALAENSGLVGAHLQAGLAYLRSSRPAQAAAEFEQELAINPEDMRAKYNLAYVYLQQSQPDKAMPLLKQVIAGDPSDADAQYQVGKVLLEQGKVQEAVPYLEQAERLSPDKDYVHYQLQTAYRRESRLQDADRELQLYKESKARNREQTLPQPEQKQYP